MLGGIWGKLEAGNEGGGSCIMCKKFSKNKT